GLAIHEIAERTLHPVEHSVRFVLGALKIWPHPLSHAIKRSVLIVLIFAARLLRAFFATGTLVINALVGRDILHGRAGEHSFSAGDVSVVRADVNRPNGLTTRRVERDDPDRIAMLIGAQRIARAVEKQAGFFS